MIPQFLVHLQSWAAITAPQCGFTTFASPTKTPRACSHPIHIHSPTQPGLHRLWTCLFWTVRMSGIVHCVVFCAASFTCVKFPGPAHIAACIGLLPSLAQSSPFRHTPHPVTHPPAKGHLACLHGYLLWTLVFKLLCERMFSFLLVIYRYIVCVYTYVYKSSLNF